MLLRDVLELPELRAGGVRIVAGAGRLDRRVRWVHSGEIADIAQFLKGGEVLLTAATGLAHADRDRRRYIRELAEVGTAAVVIELGRTFTAIPPEMIKEADQHGLVLITLDREVPFIAVTQAAHTSIVNAHHDMLVRAAEIGDDVDELVVNGAPLSEILHLLAQRLGNPVLLEDAARHVVAFGRASSPVTPLLQAWRAHTREGHRISKAVGVQVSDATPTCVWSPIALRGETWGRLHVVGCDAPFDDAARLAVGRAAAAIALHLMTERDATHLGEAAEHSLIKELAQGRFSGEDFLARATGLGLDFEGPLVVIVAQPGSATDTPERASSLTSSGASLRQTMRELSWPSLVASLSGGVVAVASATPPGGLTRALTDMTRRLEAAKTPVAHVGVSRPAKVSMLQRAFGEAELCHRLGPKTDTSQIHHYDDLVLYRLLAPLMSGPELANFVESEIGELIAHDEQHSSELVATLDAYLLNNGSKAATGQALFLQRRSVYYRLERIAEVLGRDIDTPGNRTRLFVALRGRDMLQARPPVTEGDGARDGRAREAARPPQLRSPRHASAPPSIA